jgi:hypothetical protein
MGEGGMKGMGEGGMKGMGEGGMKGETAHVEIAGAQ